MRHLWPYYVLVGTILAASGPTVSICLNAVMLQPGGAWQQDGSTSHSQDAGADVQ